MYEHGSSAPITALNILVFCHFKLHEAPNSRWNLAIKRYQANVKLKLLAQMRSFILFFLSEAALPVKTLDTYEFNGFSFILVALLSVGNYY